MQVTLVSYWVACVMTWGPPLSSSSLSSLPSSGRAGGFCVRGASALRLASSPSGTSLPALHLAPQLLPFALCLHFRGGPLGGILGRQATLVAGCAWIALVYGLAHHGMALLVVTKFLRWVREYGTWSAVVCSLWWQLVRRQRDICMIFSILVWTLWLCHLSGCYP